MTNKDWCNISLEEFNELSGFINEKEMSKTKFSLVCASYTAWQIGIQNGACKINSFEKYLNKLGIKYGKSEKLTKEESKMYKKKALAVSEKISKMKGLRKG